MATTLKNPGSTLRAGGELKRNNASLVGGIVIGIGIFVLWTLIAVELGHRAASAPVVLGGVVLGALVGGWVRLADL